GSIEPLHVPLRVDALDAAGLIIRRRADRQALVPGKAAVVGDIQRTTRTARRAVGSATGPGEHRQRAVRGNLPHPPAANLDDVDRVVAVADRAFGKFQTGGDKSFTHGMASLLSEKQIQRSPGRLEGKTVPACSASTTGVYP